MASISRDTFNGAKHYDKLVFQRDKALVDAELNELQDINRLKMRKIVANALVGSPNLGFKIVGSSLANDFTIKAGDLFAKGFVCAKEADELYSAQADYQTGRPPLTTPGGARTDIVYLHIFEDEIDSTEDANIKDPTLAVETAVRTRLRFRVRVAEGGSMPVDDATNWYFQLAVMNRTAQANIDAGMVADSRPSVVAEVTDHGALTGLADDDHGQYHTDARGDARYTAIAHASNTSNPHSVTKAQVGLGSADNTSDAAKPVSTAQQTALNLKANLASPAFTGTVSGIDKTMVGLANVDNTSDAAKPVSTAQQTALNLKAPIASPTFTGTVGGVTKAMVGLGSADNTADAAKSVLYAATAGSAAASDVYAWAKAAVKPTYTKSEVGLANVDNTADAAKSVSYAATAGAAPASDVYAWAKAAVKPSYTKTEVGLDNVANAAQVQLSTITTKGDIVGCSSPNVAARVPVGTNGQVLTADSTLGTGVKWATPASVITDHGALTGLSDDDHSQYHTDARGDARYTAIAHASNVSNPHSVTKAQVGLGSADDTADAAKNVMSATKLTTARTLNGASFDGQANVVVPLGPMTSTLASDHTASGLKADGVCGETLAIGDLCYMKSDGKYWKANATSAAKMPGLVLALAAGAATEIISFLVQGYFRDDTYNRTIGALLFADTTDGLMTTTKPSAAGNQVQVLGVVTPSAGVTGTHVYFNPSLVVIGL